MKYKKLQKNKAFTLVETLVAISIFTVSLLGIMSVLASSISSTNYAKQKMTATYLAQEGIEYVRNMRDTDVLASVNNHPAGWTVFKLALPLPSNTPSDIFYPTTSGFSSFTRTITADTTTFGSDEVKITSTVTWNQGSGVQNVTFSENLFNWYE